MCSGWLSAGTICQLQTVFLVLMLVSIRLRGPALPTMVLISYLKAASSGNNYFFFNFQERPTYDALTVAEITSLPKNEEDI